MVSTVLIMGTNEDETVNYKSIFEAQEELVDIVYTVLIISQETVGNHLSGTKNFG